MDLIKQMNETRQRNIINHAFIQHLLYPIFLLGFLFMLHTIFFCFNDMNCMITNLLILLGDKNGTIHYGIMIYYC